MKFPKIRLNWAALLAAIFKPTQYIEPKCLICGKPLHSFPGSPYLMCDNGHKFPREALPKNPGEILNSGDFHGDL